MCMRRPLARTTTFVQIWSNHPPAVGPAGTIMDTNILSPERGLTFWRPKPPIGYASLGDCVTTGTAQPSFQVPEDCSCTERSPICDIFRWSAPQYCISAG